MSQIMTAEGWKQLAPRNCRSASNDHGRYEDGFVKYEGIEMAHATKAWIVGVQRETAEMAKDRIERRGHNRFI